MVLRGTSLTLPLADLVMQLRFVGIFLKQSLLTQISLFVLVKAYRHFFVRIEIPDVEAMISDSICCGNADMVAVLLRYHPMSSTLRNIQLHSLIACAEKTEQKKIVDMVCLDALLLIFLLPFQQDMDCSILFSVLHVL